MTTLSVPVLSTLLVVLVLRVHSQQYYNFDFMPPIFTHTGQSLPQQNLKHYDEQFREITPLQSYTYNPSIRYYQQMYPGNVPQLETQHQSEPSHQSDTVVDAPQASPLSEQNLEVMQPPSPHLDHNLPLSDQTASEVDEPLALRSSFGDRIPLLIEPSIPLGDYKLPTVDVPFTTTTSAPTTTTEKSTTTTVPSTTTPEPEETTLPVTTIIPMDWTTMPVPSSSSTTMSTTKRPRRRKTVKKRKPKTTTTTSTTSTSSPETTSTTSTTTSSTSTTESTSTSTTSTTEKSTTTTEKSTTTEKTTRAPRKKKTRKTTTTTPRPTTTTTVSTTTTPVYIEHYTADTEKPETFTRMAYLKMYDCGFDYNKWNKSCCEQEGKLWANHKKRLLDHGFLLRFDPGSYSWRGGLDGQCVRIVPKTFMFEAAEPRECQSYGKFCVWQNRKCSCGPQFVGKESYRGNTYELFMMGAEVRGMLH